MLLETLDFIEKGKSGQNKGVHFSLERLNKYVKIWKGRYYLYFALSGVGKSKLVYDQHLFNLLDQQINKNVLTYLNIDLYSLEISPITVMASIMIQYLHKYYNIITDTNQVFSFDKVLNKELYNKLHSKELKEYMTEVEKYLKIYTHLSFNTLIGNTNKKLETFGKLHKHESGRILKFEPYDDNYIYQIMVDHISLTDIIKGMSRYETIGTISRYFFAMRNLTGITPIVVQQVNPDRTRKLEDTVSPSHEDLRDNKETYNDSDIAIAIGNPFKHQIRTFEGYKILKSAETPFTFENRFRFLDIRKNRYGTGENMIIPALFIGETSHYTDLKDPKDLDDKFYLGLQNIKKTFIND